MRLKNKIAIVVGAGQGPGTGMGNGRATVIRFAQEGAKVLCVDRDLKSAEETCAMAAKETNAGECAAFEADVTREASMKAMIGWSGTCSLPWLIVTFSPAGIFTSICFSRSTRPWPRHLSHGEVIICPVPRQLPQVRETEKKPC